MDPLPWHWKLAVAAILASSLAAGLWVYFKPRPAPVSIPVIAKPALPNVERETVTVPLKVYKPESKKRLNLPKSLQMDPAQHVAAASRIAPDDHPHTISTVINSDTGEVTTYDVREKLPWLAVDAHGEAGIGYGYKFSPGHGFGPMGRLVVRQNLLDVKAATVSVQGTLDSDGEAFAGVFVTARW